MTTTVARNDAAVGLEDITIWFNWVMGSILGFVCLVVFVGCLDARKLSTNELFHWNSIYMFGFHSIDFCSDIFLSIELYLIMTDNYQENSNSYRTVYLVLFTSSVSFIIIPFVTNLYQMHVELSKWLVDPVLTKTDVQLWILGYVRILYIIALVTGNSFSAVALCNSHLFRWKVFSMGLSRYHQRNFRNRRFFSIVLLEV